MNKTFSIGLAGFSFTIDEHAYMKLSDYLQALRASLAPEEADEVMHDIEIRIVEIFREMLGKREVINSDDVDRVIAQIGKPELIEEQEEAYYSDKPSAAGSDTTSAGPKQLFRDPERQRIAGVCSGLAYYVGMDIRAMRAVWLGLFLFLIPIPGSPMLMVFLYAILWMVIPKAQTAADFLKMKGKPMNFDNLKQESNKLVQFANESTQRVGEIYNENKPYINTAGNRLWDIIRYVLGAFFALIGLSLLLGSFAVFGVGTFDSPNVHFFDNLGFYLQDSNLGFLAIALGFLTLFIPALIFSYLAMKLFSPKTTLRNTGYLIGALALIWIGLAAATGFTALKFKTQYSGQNDETENVALNTTSDSLLVDMKKVPVPSHFKAYWDDVFSDGKTIYKADYPDIEVKHQSVDAPYLVIQKSADGYNLPLEVKVPVEIVGNKVLLPNYIQYSYANRLRDYRVDYQLIVPPGMKVIPLNDEQGYSLSDDEASDDDGHDNTQGKEQTVVNINGKTWNITKNTADKGSVTINGRKYSEQEADRLMDSLNINVDDMVNLNIRNGKKEISIKTK